MALPRNCLRQPLQCKPHAPAPLAGVVFGPQFFSEITMAFKVFVDGQEGTTGLRLLDYLSQRDDIELLRIAEDKRRIQPSAPNS